MNTFAHNTTVALGVTGLLVGPALLAPPAFAVATADDCTTIGGTMITDTVCSVSFTESTAVVVPASVTHLEAILVGGGGSGHGGYGGGSGDVIYVDDVPGSELDITIGAGSAEAAAQGGTTTLSNGVDAFDADGGTAGYYLGGTAIGGGNTTNPGHEIFVAGQDSPSGTGYFDFDESTEYGRGVKASDIEGVTAALWPAYEGERCFADGGMGDTAYYNGGSAPECGGGSLHNEAYQADGVDGTGSGAAGAPGGWNGEAVFEGGDGLVILRFEVPADDSAEPEVTELADTGVDAELTAGLALTALGAVALATGIRARRRS